MKDLNLNNILNNILCENIVSDDEVANAIDSKKCVIIDYDDERPDPPRGDRLIEPCALGYTKANNLALRAYEYKGKTRRGVPKWKLFRIDRIKNWKPTALSFNIKREMYNDITDNSLHNIITIAKFNGMSDMIARNLQITKQDNSKRGKDSLGRKIQKQSVGGPVGKPNQNNTEIKPNVQQTKSGPVYNSDIQKEIDKMYADRDKVDAKQKSSDLRKGFDAIYHKNKRQAERANGLTALSKGNKIGDNEEIRSKDYEETPEYLEYLRRNGLRECNEILRELGYLK